MTINQVLEALSVAVGLIFAASAVVSVVLFAKYKGTIDALKEAVNSYQSVAEARAEEILELKKEIVNQNARIESLERKLIVANEAVAVAVAESLKAYRDFFKCPKCGNQLGGE